jgi:uncharacterized Zn-binding protein involved in type VI secretion
MSAYLLHQGATVQCMHGGQAQATVTSQKVKVGGQFIVTQSGPYTIAGCSYPPPTAGNGPCVTAQWISAATRVTANGVPVLLQDSNAICTPTGTGLDVITTQMRVKGI